jgi:hypothetical protein
MTDTPRTTDHKKDAYDYLRNQSSSLLRPYLRQLSYGAVNQKRAPTLVKRLLKTDAKVKL